MATNKWLTQWKMPRWCVNLSPASMETLPPEMVSHIVAYLPLRDRLAMRCVLRCVGLWHCFRGAPSSPARLLQAAVLDDDAHRLQVLHNELGLGVEHARHALRMAATWGHLRVLHHLREVLGLGADDARAQQNEALCMAAANGHVDAVRYLREEFGLGADDARAQNNWPLRLAAQGGHVQVLRYFREGFGLASSDARADNNYALRTAATWGHLCVLRYLKEGFGLGADDARADNNYALRASAHNGHMDVVRYLRGDLGLGLDAARARAH